MQNPNWIFSSLIHDIIDSVIVYYTAHEVWEDLQNRFSQNHAPRIFQIRETLLAWLKIKWQSQPITRS